jgi:hypothetical protein
VSCALPEADLIAAIFERARLDGLAPLENTTSRIGTAKKARDLKTSLHDALQAWTFLTDTHGEWAAHRNWLAGLVGGDGDVIREAAIKQGPSRSARIALERMRAMQKRIAEQEKETAAQTAARKAVADARKAARRAAQQARRATWWTAEDTEKLKLMRRQGRPAQHIAKALGRSVKAIQNRAKKIGLVEAEAMLRAWSASEDDFVREQYMAGASLDFIGETLKRTPHAVSHRARILGLSRPHPVNRRHAA